MSETEFRVAAKKYAEQSLRIMNECKPSRKDVEQVVERLVKAFSSVSFTKADDDE